MLRKEYNAGVQKTFYASGFLYHQGSAQILLQQQDPANERSSWSLLGSESLGRETSGESFRRLAHTFLHLNLSFSAIHSVYEYFHAGLRKKNFVSYAEVDKLENFPPMKKTVFAWFTQKQITKLNVSKLTMQDIIVGQRVINAEVRKKAGGRSIE